MMKEHLESDKITCPICGKENISFKDYFIFCNHCGWEGNLNIDENIVELNGYSAKDYKKIYQEYTKEHPNYIWKEDKEALEKFCDSFINYGSKCPVCNEDSMSPDFRYCYKCGWKYNFVQAQFPDFENSSNKLSLNQYKNQYDSLIKDNLNYKWKNTNEVKMPFDKKQIKWLKNNEFCKFDKLTSEKKLNQIIDDIGKLQEQCEEKKDYENYMLIKSILDIILTNI